MSVVWMIPYELMSEFVIVFRKILERTLDCRVVFHFFNWYYGIQNQFNEYVRLTPDEYVWNIKMIDTETQKKDWKPEPEMISSLKVIGDTFDKDATARSIFMCSVIDRFFKENPQYYDWLRHM